MATFVLPRYRPLKTLPTFTSEQRGVKFNNHSIMND